MWILFELFFGSWLFKLIKAVLFVVSFFLLLGIYFRLGDIRELLRLERKEKNLNDEEKR